MWIAKSFGVRRPEFTNIFESVLGPPRTTRTWDSVSDLGQKVRVVCRGCNSGWMSDLERQAIRLMRPMIFAIGEISLASEDQRSLAIWASKTHQMYRYGLVGRAPSASAREHLYRQQEPPPGTFVWLAAWRGASKAFVDITAHRHRFFTKKDATDEGLEFEAELLTFRIGHLVIQTIEIPSSTLDVGNVDSRIDQVILPLWPARLDEIAWPPPVFLDDAGLDRFDGRWHRLWLGNPAPPR